MSLLFFGSDFFGGHQSFGIVRHDEDCLLHNHDTSVYIGRLTSRCSLDEIPITRLSRFGKANALYPNREGSWRGSSLTASWRSSSRVKPCNVWASRYSLARSEPKKAGSSELMRHQQAGVEVTAQADGRRKRRRRRCGHWRWDSVPAACALLSAPASRSKSSNGRKRVADALGADGERLSNGLGAGGFAGVIGEPQACRACLRVECAKGLGAGAGARRRPGRCR